MGRMTSFMVVCVNSTQKHGLSLGTSNNRVMDRLENPLPRQNESALTTSLSKQTGSSRRGGGKVEKKTEQKSNRFLFLFISYLLLLQSIFF